MFRSISDRFSTLQLDKKVILITYIINFLSGLAVVILFSSRLDSTLRDSSYKKLLIEELDFTWMGWFFSPNQKFLAGLDLEILGTSPLLYNLELILTRNLSSLTIEIWVIGIFCLLLQSFITAAIVGSFVDNSTSTSLQIFLRNGMGFFWLIVRVHLLTISLIASFFWLFGPPLAKVVKIFAENIVSQGIFLPLILFLKMISVYAKITVITENRTSVFLGYFSAFRFCISNFFSAAFLYLTLILFGVLFALIYAGVESLIPQITEPGILTKILLQQAYVLGKLGIHIFSLAAQTHFFLKHEGLFRQ